MSEKLHELPAARKIAEVEGKKKKKKRRRRKKGGEGVELLLFRSGKGKQLTVKSSEGGERTPENVISRQSSTGSVHDTAHTLRGRGWEGVERG